MQRSKSNVPLSESWIRFILVLVLFLALTIRLSGLDWDGFYHLHPDERYIVWVGTTIEFPDKWVGAFDPVNSTFNPFHWPPNASSRGIRVEQGEPRAFAYGHWPLYLGVAVTHLLERGAEWGQSLPTNWVLARELVNATGRIEYDHLLIVGRALSAFFDSITVWLVYRLGRRLYRPIVGLIAAALAAMAVLHVQSAHFFITDPFLGTSVVASVLWMVRRTQTRRFSDTLIAGAFTGLAIGAKFSAILLLLPLAVSVISNRHVPPVARWAGLKKRCLRLWRWVRRPAVELMAAVFIGIAVFAITNPFALLDNTCLETIGGLDLPVLDIKTGSITVGSCYLENIARQSAMVRGSNRMPFTFQYIGTPPYLYFVNQMARWGLGVPLTLVAFGGLIWVIYRAVRRRLIPGEIILIAWVVPFFLITGSFQVKFLRYLIPMLPFLIVLGTAMLLGERIDPARGAAKPVAATIRNKRIFQTAAIGITLIFTTFYAEAFANMYKKSEHPWVTTSRWMFENLLPGDVVATEHWDDSLPLYLDPDDRSGTALSFRNETLEWYYVEDRTRDEKDRISLEVPLESLARSDYLVLASNRLYGVIPRLPDRYPEAAAYYRLLFSGELGFELVFWQGRFPSWGSIALVDDPFRTPGLERPEPMQNWIPYPVTVMLGPADESFTVYDHPLVFIFENRTELSAEELAIRINAQLK